MEGLILGNRYELIEKIGGGGMALVYKARCRLLDRFVAVKILRPEFTNDEEFVKRFRIEAQAAASLTHPNIVSIYDVGQEDSLHYIVMEYVDGVTLKEYIQKKGTLQWREAVNIAIQICSAIEQAHRHHIVHRDIKPHNILLTKDGIAKVTDFGIARAVSSSTITMVGSTIGSVHYFSPEQARGGYTDEKSDLYSLGIALYEMVTGKLPFDGETPVAVALKHIQEQPAEPREYNEKIPAGVNEIIMKAIRKEQNTRYQNASALLSDLNRVLSDPYGDFSDAEITEDMPTKKIKAISDEEIEKLKNGKTEDPEVKKKRKDTLAVILAIITGLVIVGIGVYFGYKVVMSAILPDTPEIVVENYVGRPFDEVKQELLQKDIASNEKEIFDENIEKGIIIYQSITPGQPLKKGGDNVIEFKVSKGPEVVVIPDMKNKEFREAEAFLNRTLNLKTSVQDEYSDTIGKDMVTRTDPGPDSEVKPDTEVIIYRSLGPELQKVEVPNLVGLTKSQAQQSLLERKLKVGKLIFPNDIISDVALVTKQVPEALSETDEDSAVDLYFTDQAAAGGDTSGQGTQPPSTQDEQTNVTNGSRIAETPPVNLSNPERYGDTIKVQVEVTPSDTGKTQVLVNENRSKDSFPLKFRVTVPNNGSTRVRILLDNVLYTEFNVS